MNRTFLPVTSSAPSRVMHSHPTFCSSPLPSLPPPLPPLQLEDVSRLISSLSSLDLSGASSPNARGETNSGFDLASKGEEEKRAGGRGGGRKGGREGGRKGV